MDFMLCHAPALLGAVSYTTYLFWQVNPLAGKLMVPYLAFTGFANALNYSILKRNPQVNFSCHPVASRFDAICCVAKDDDVQGA